MMNFKAFAAAAAITLAPFAASAVPISGSGANSASAVLNQGGVGSMVTFDFTNDDSRELRLQFSFSGTGTTAALQNIEYQLMIGGMTYGPETYDSVGKGAAFTEIGDDFGTWLLGVGQTASVTFFDTDAAEGPGVTATAFYAPVPLPAAAWMLLGGMAGLGILGRRRARA